MLRSSLLKSISNICSYSTLLCSGSLPTIYALSTPPGQKSAIAVIRITGSHCKYIYQKLTGLKENLNPRQTILRRIYRKGNNTSRILLDNPLILYFKSPKSFTGEDILELHLHGGKSVTNGVLNTIQSFNDRDSGLEIRHALPGEFSLRAFQNSKFDLTEIEGIKELIDAETESQRRSALSSFMGENKIKFLEWRTRIINNIAQLAAIIDFGDDTEIENINHILNNVEEKIIELEKEIQKFIKKVEKASILQDGIRLALLGTPNTGKSSLINSIVNDDVSIVSNIPGTTRDSVGTTVNINGYKVIICDTAGIREQTTDEIELLGIEKAKEKVEQSDICLVLIDPSNRPLVSDELVKFLSSSKMQNKHIRIVINKADLVNNKSELITLRNTLKEKYGQLAPVNVISCLTKSGVETLIEELTISFKSMSTNSDDSNPTIVSERVKDILINDVLYGIEAFRKNNRNNKDVVIMSESLRYAVDGIGKITGNTVGVEEVLETVFANFCVGK